MPDVPRARLAQAWREAPHGSEGDLQDLQGLQDRRSVEVSAESKARSDTAEARHRGDIAAERLGIQRNPNLDAHIVTRVIDGDTVPSGGAEFSHPH